MKSINDRIRERRTALKLSQERVAAELGITYQAVQKWEKPGGTTPRRKRMEDLARLLNTTIEWLETGYTPVPARSRGKVAEHIQSAKSIPVASLPFNPVILSALEHMTMRELGYIEGRLAAAIEEVERARPAKQQTGNSA